MTRGNVREDGFPADLWAACGIGDAAAAIADAQSLTATLGELYGLPRSVPELLSAFVRTVLPAGRYLIYGAGLHSRMLLPLIAARQDITVCGVLDRLASSMDGFEGLPVLPPRRAADEQYDHILISHGSYEREMVDTLLGLGVAPKRIVPIYTNPAYRAICRTFLEDRIARAVPGGIRYVVVTSIGMGIVGEKDLARVFPPDQTIHVFMGRPDTAGSVQRFPTIDAYESLEALACVIDAVRPDAVYLSTTLNTNHIAPYLKERFPEVTLVHELYDMSLCWPDKDLEILFGLDARSIRRLRLAERYTAEHADLVISKRGGAAWDEGVWASCRAPCQLFFPQLTDPGPQEPLGDEERRDILYAGFLPSPAFLARFKNGYTFIPVLRELCAAQGLTADIFNSGHFEGGGDAVYSDYQATFADGPVRYFGRVPYDRLLQRMPNYGLGWLCDVQPEVHPDRHVGICNRWTGYLSGGIPTLLDSGWRFMSELVRSHRAGIIVDRQEPEAILTAIRAHDLMEVAAGARRLRRDLLAWNDKTLDTLGAVVAKGRTKQAQAKST